MLIRNGFRTPDDFLVRLAFQKLRSPPYVRGAGREMMVGISTFGAASANALNCSGFRNITEPREQA